MFNSRWIGMNRIPFLVKLRGYWMIAGLLLVSGPLFYVLYHHLYQRGQQAEARLILTYLHTLQKVYKQESGSFAYFPSYGAPQRGQDFCEQPFGAAQLGFAIHACHQAGALPPRYTYQSLEIKEESRGRIGPSYKLEARGGSDSQRRSLVCFKANGEELWVSSTIQELEPIESCW